MARRRPILRRLDLLCLGASPEKLAQGAEIPAASPRSITPDQSERLYILKHREAQGVLEAWEQLELDRLRRLL
jgi:hypothetical protein